MKCLEKDRRRRYETANGLAMDIRRHLDHEPVVARPPSAMYRLGKTWCRNKLVFATSTTVLAAMIGALTVSTWSLVKEREARDRAVLAEQEQVELRQQAESEAARSAHVAGFLREMLERRQSAVGLVA